VVAASTCGTPRVVGAQALSWRESPNREAAERFRIWLAETAPSVAAAAGPDRLDDLPAQFRPVIVDTSCEGPALF
jgi:hypothetical protein